MPEDISGWITTAVVILLALHPVASALVALTPTPVDNKVLALLYRILEYLAGAIGHATTVEREYANIKKALVQVEDEIEE